MRLLIKDRGTGKTTGLIYTSESTGFPIIVSSYLKKEQVVEQAKKLNCTIPEPITVRELKTNRGIRFLKDDNSGVLIDDVTDILEDALTDYLGVPVCCATMSDIIK